MLYSHLEKSFARIGASVDIVPNQSRFSVDVFREHRHEGFRIRLSPSGDNVIVLQADRDRRHLLLLHKSLVDTKSKFLCGHDERHWFAAAVPNSSGVSTIQTAISALKPQAVQARETRLQVPTRKRDRRRNPAFLRQGEWFFVPMPHLNIGSAHVLRNEPLRRGLGKPHIVEFVLREGGETIYVNAQGHAISRVRFDRLDRSKRADWTPMVRNPAVYAKGKVRHADHATIELIGWHRVFMNTENEAPGMKHLAFLD